MKESLINLKSDTFSGANLLFVDWFQFHSDWENKLVLTIVAFDLLPEENTKAHILLLNDG